jgi:hypothetical protein
METNDYQINVGKRTERGIMSGGHPPRFDENNLIYLSVCDMDTILDNALITHRGVQK